MHSVYWVVSKDCNQRCGHCYNNSEPGAPGLTTEEASRVVRNLPEPGTVPIEQVMLSGGEVLVWPELLFHTLGELHARYGFAVELQIQTNGDLLDGPMLDRLLGHHVARISVSGMDRYHLPQTLAREAELHRLMESRGLARAEWVHVRPGPDRPPQYNVWGMTEDKWVGKLWPRGRAEKSGLSKADGDTDFCGIWSGAKDFLNYHHPDCQVNVQLADVYPCCPMTCRPIGSLLVEPLIALLDRCAAHPAFRALNEGKPERVGEFMGIDEAYGRRRSRELGNHCLWCDEFFSRHAPDLLPAGLPTERGTVDLTIRGNRLARKAAAAAAAAGVSA